MKNCFLFTVNKRRGFTLTELAIVLGVIGVVLGGIWYVAETVRDNARVSAAINQMNIVAQNMTSLLQGGYGSGIPNATNITAALITAQVIPSWMTISATQTSNPWFTPAVGNGTSAMTLFWMNNSPKTYRVSFYMVGSQSSCIGLINQATACTPGQPGCPTAITVDVGLVPAVNLMTTSLTSTTLQALCANNSYSGGNNSVEFDFTN